MAKSEKEYQLKDQETSFYDSETGLSVTRSEVVSIDTSKGTGKATLRAIKAGALIEVNRESKASAKSSEESPAEPKGKGGAKGKDKEPAK